MRKKNEGLEFKDPEEVLKWKPVEGLPPGAWEIVLFRDKETGTYVRLLRLERGHKGLPHPMVHDFYEVVYNLSGEIVNDLNGKRYGSGTCACFPPGQKHGPFSSPEGNLAIEFRYFK